MNAPNPRGRPRRFDPDTALEAMTNVFWQKGFVGTSMSDLTDATGMNKPSLYAAFGDKEQIYLLALARYRETCSRLLGPLLEDAPVLHDAMRNFLCGLADILTGEGFPGGCFITNGAVACGTGGIPEAVDAAIRAAGGTTAAMLHARLARAQREGELPDTTDITTLTELFATLAVGMSSRAKSGASRAALYRMIDEALRLLPPAAKPSRRKAGS